MPSLADTLLGALGVYLVSMASMIRLRRKEPELERLGMRTLLAVGQGSVSPSKVVVMQWQGATG